MQKSTNGTIETKGINSCLLGHKIATSSIGKEDGIFAEWQWDGRKLIVKNDRYGYFPLYYCSYNDQIIISPSIQRLIEEGAPVDPDYPALSIFLRLGFFIGEDTPFKHIKALPPDADFYWENGKLTVRGQFIQNDIINISEDDAIEQYIHLFRQSIKRRLPSDETFTVPLSAGRDSRHIILELDHLGYKPKTCLTVRPYAFFYDEDINQAKILADALGVNQILLDSGKFKFDDVIRNLELTNYCADEHAWFLPLADYLKEKQIGTIYDGIAGDTLSADWWLPKEIELVQTKKYAEYFKLMAAILIKPDDYVLKQVLDKEFYNKATLACSVEHFTEELKKHEQCSNPVRSFYFWNRTRREIALAPYAINADIPKVYSPYLDHDLYDFLMSLPEEIKNKGDFHTKTIQRAYPQYANIPYEAPFEQKKEIFLSGAMKHKVQFIKNFSIYYLKNCVVSSNFIKAKYFLPRMFRCLIDRKYCESSWWMDPPTLLYFIELEKLQRRGRMVYKTLSVIVPVYNEKEVLPEFHKRLSAVLDSINLQAEILYVNDGSSDETLSIVNELKQKDARAAFIDFSRNFGKEIAVTAGLDHAIGDAVVVIDADLQDPPELIPELFKQLQEGYDVVYAQRSSRKGETILKESNGIDVLSFYAPIWKNNIASKYRGFPYPQPQGRGRAQADP